MSGNNSRFVTGILFTCIVGAISMFASGLWLLTEDGRRPPPKMIEKQNVVEKDKDKVEEILHVKPVNLLVLGLDEESERSDVIVLLNFDPSNGKVNILSITRDTRVHLKNKDYKMNALIAVGGEDLVINKVEELLGLKVDYYITVNFKGFRKIVDIVDGVEVDVPIDMNYDDPLQHLHIHLKKGRQILNGDKAEQFVRYRKGNKAGEGYIRGDIDRVIVQQEFIKAFIDQKIKIKYLPKFDEIIYAMSKYTRTNFGLSDINFYLKDMLEVRGEDIKSYTLPGSSGYVGKQWFFVHDEDKTRELIIENFAQ